MRIINFGTPPSDPGQLQRWIIGNFRQIEQADRESVRAILAEFSVTGTFTESRTLDADTATLPDVVNFLCTVFSDLKKGGQKRSYGS